MKKKVISKNEKFTSKLEALRLEIDSADRLLIQVLKHRFQAVKKVGTLKVAHELPLFQKERWNRLVEDRLKQAGRAKVDGDFMRSLLKLIHKEAMRIQRGDK